MSSEKVKKSNAELRTNSSELIRVAILTTSDKGSRGEREDKSGDLIKEMVKGIPGEVVYYEVIPDEKDIIKDRLASISDNEEADIILTTGGTGLSPRDVTPDATIEVIDKEIPGMAEAMRIEGLKKTPYAMISRAVVGIRKRTLIINLPGSPKGAKENLEIILPALSHAVEKIKGDTSECGSGQ
jgi:molybdenum cofactor synthesis domain-containing protein